MLKNFFALFKTKEKEIEKSHYDLNAIYDDVNHRYFEGNLSLKIQWVGKRHSLAKRRIVFGSYHQKKKLIKIHRRLDQAVIPYHFISFIVYHEMLHHVLPPIKGKNRRQIHHKAFVEREKNFQEYVEVKKFQESFFSSSSQRR